MKKITKVLLVLSFLTASFIFYKNETKIFANDDIVISLKNQLQTIKTEEFDQRPITEITTISSVVYAPTAVAFEINEIKNINGIWQLRCKVLAPVGFNWTDNGIPLGVIYFTNGSGQTWNGTQSSFKFTKNMAYRTGNNGWNYGHRWYEYTYPGYGTWWMAANY
ncbi:lytic exoenzyme target recognition domain-containing protein [Breznakia pachnodae]|uniref:Lytic exoenzyme target recognition domain-containing protein n=1 Tax=Breznakia pachnodae TaxID=265178 RepID=A0ABU0E7A6_9FIRM|nr:lytic exoenzyme target recognition domain-containing protein [Breznakia pachnodae]MDQ0362789.1 hypothetical protein [Breznakia pachnodae]